MILIHLSPVRAKSPTILSVVGTVVTIGEELFDLALLEEGASAYHDKLGQVTRTGDDYEITVVLYHGKAAPMETRFPTPLSIVGDYTHTYIFEDADE